MSHSLGYNSNKSQVADSYYSMPKFDFGAVRTNPMITKHAFGSSIASKQVQFKPIPFDDVLYTIVEPTVLRMYTYLDAEIQFRFSLDSPC